MYGLKIHKDVKHSKIKLSWLFKERYLKSYLKRERETDVDR